MVGKRILTGIPLVARTALEDPPVAAHDRVLQMILEKTFMVKSTPTVCENAHLNTHLNLL
jgi:hypothetical protein